MSEPWICFEDEHLVVVNKPAGVNTHRADPHGQEGLYEWVQRQRPGRTLSILHRLDKATSGILVFGASTEANRSLTRQFEQRSVAKTYELLVRRDPRRPTSATCELPIEVSGRSGNVDRAASTSFDRRSVGERVELHVAHPHTGRTHQVRIHAAELGMAVIGDTEHGGAPGNRLFLHAAALRFAHPTGATMELATPRPASFDQVLGGAHPASPAVAASVALEAREQLFDPADTGAYLWIDRHHDGFPDVRVERLGDVALVIDHRDHAESLPSEWIDAWTNALPLSAIYHQPRHRKGGSVTARQVWGDADERFVVRELGLEYLIDLGASSTSSGLFLDQRETRRRLLTWPLDGRTVLNTFAHTGSLSVAAAAAGAETLTLDLSPRYLDWARENLRLNGTDPMDHDFIYGDAQDWMARLERKGRTFDVVLLDPPSSSTSGKRGAKRWVAERDLHDLVARGARLCALGGTLFVSTNLHRMRWERFLTHLDTGMRAARRSGSVEIQTLPLDHRSGPGDPPYLKAAWVHLDDGHS
ncbi:MAG: class I SAM-dependent methyltransferase [Acidimicrobiia bacterium]|nr:class I SAM-dependent methyltransferase [Acidimicrobiia bacterium]